MRNYLTDPDSCQHTPKTSCDALKAREPLRVLQISSVGTHPTTMSASTRSGVPRSNLIASRHLAESRLKKNPTSSSSQLLKERNAVNNSNVSATKSTISNPSGTVNDKASSQSTSRTKSNKMLAEPKNKSGEASDIPVNKVGSLTSSPKWSRIKDKFENTDTDGKAKLRRSSSLSRSEIESLTPKKFASQSTSKSLTSLSFDSSLSSGSPNSAIQKHTSNASKSSSEHFRSINTKHKLQANSEDGLQNRDKLNISSGDAQRKHSEIIKVSNNSYLIPTKVDSTYGKTEQNVRTKSVPLSAKVAASRLIPSSTSVASKSEQKANTSAVSKKSHRDRPIMGYGAQSFGKPSGRKSPHRSVLQSSRTKAEDSKQLSRSETKSPQRDVHKVSSSVKDVFQAPYKATSKSSTTPESEQSCSNVNHSAVASANNQIPNSDPSSQPHQTSDVSSSLQSKGNVKSIWVKDNIGGWRKQNMVAETGTQNKSNESKVGVTKNKFSFSNDSSSQSIDESFRGNRTALSRSSTTSSVPAKPKEDISNTDLVGRQLNKSYTTSSISSVMQLKNQNEENFKNVSDSHHVNGTASSKSPKEHLVERPVNNILLENNKLKSHHPTKEDNAKKGSPENIRKLRLVQRAVLCYEGNSSTLSPETQRKLKLISENIKAQTDDDKLLVAKAKVEMLSTNVYRKSSSAHSKINSERPPVESNNTLKSKSGNQVEQTQHKKTFLSRYQTAGKTLDGAKKCSSNDSPSAENEIQKKKDVRGNGTEQKSSLRPALSKHDQSNTSSSGKTKTETHAVQKHAPGPYRECNEYNSSANAKESPEHSIYANHVVDNRFLFAKEKQLSKKIPHGKQQHPLQPNASFLWRNSSSTEDESKGVYESSVKQKAVDDHNYYDLENYYSSVEPNTDKQPHKMSEPIYSDSEYGSVHRNNYGSVQSSKVNAATSALRTSDRGKLDTDDGWTDLSDEDGIYAETSSNTNTLSSTLKKRKNKKHSSRKAPLRRSWSQSLRDLANASDSCENSDWVENESNVSSPRQNDDDNLDMGDHLYEPVYESLGNYLITDDYKENTSVPLSPDSEVAKDAHSSFTSLESEENNSSAGKQSGKSPPEVPTDCSESSTGIGKKAGDKIRQLKRHLSWGKNDFKLELSSKFNKIKIQKDLNDTTEIGVRVQEDNPPSVTSKKKTFIRCILKHKNANVPVKRTVSPKKENAMFYVHLSMGREKQRPCSDSCVDTVSSETSANEQLQKSRKRSEPSINFVKSRSSSSMRQTRTSSGVTIQRPKTPPPLPPANYMPKDSVKSNSLEYNASRNSGPKLFSKGESVDSAYKSYSSYDSDCVSVDNSSLLCDVRKSYSVPDSKSYVLKAADSQESTHHRITDDLLEFQIEHRQSITSLSSIMDSFPVSSIFYQRTRGSLASSISGESYAPADESGSSGTSSSTAYSFGMTPPASEADAQDYCGSRTGSLTSGLSLPPFGDFKNDLLKSPFEEEPMYQFYHKDVQQRATLWCTTDGSESEFEDDVVSKPAEQSQETSSKPPVLQSQLSAMELIHSGQRTLWCEVPEVHQSGILEKISPQDRKIQEAMFEVITSEASYLKSLNFLWEHFVQCPEFSGDYSEKHVLDKRERHVLFSDIPPVRDVSARLLADLEKRWLENILLSNICDIIYHHASRYFQVYVKYCSNQLYQERTLKELKENRPEFVEVLKRLESNAICQGLDMHSFLLLPMQRITRLPLLVDAIFHRISVESPIYESCKMALATLNKIVAECNEGARKMERMEEMLLISHQLDFRECKGLGLLSASRWLVKKGELVRLLLDTTNRRTFGRNFRWCKNHLYVFLFTDVLVVTRKKSDDNYVVVDYCPRNMVQVMPVDENTTPLPARLPSSYKNFFQLIMLNNQEGRTVEMILSCLLESDRTRWMDALTPAKSENPDEKIYEEWDCPQVQCTHSYSALQPDELSLEEADVVNVFRKMADGWYEGERIRDGIRGWFPSSHTVEIISSHVRARNLRQRYRLLMLSQTYLEEQYRAQATQVKGK